MKTERKANPSGSFVEESNSHQNSVEVGQSAKGDWYTKSIKVYETDDEPMSVVLDRFMRKAEILDNGRNNEMVTKKTGTQ
jgi:hypothetical protein